MAKEQILVKFKSKYESFIIENVFNNVVGKKSFYIRVLFQRWELNCVPADDLVPSAIMGAAY